MGVLIVGAWEVVGDLTAGSGFGAKAGAPLVFAAMGLPFMGVALTP